MLPIPKWAMLRFTTIYCESHHNLGECCHNLFVNVIQLVCSYWHHSLLDHHNHNFLPEHWKTVNKEFNEDTSLQYFRILIKDDDDAHCPGMAQWDSSAGRVRQVIVAKVVMMMMVVVMMMMKIMVMMTVMIPLRMVTYSLLLVGSTRLWSWSTASWAGWLGSSLQ